MTNRALKFRQEQRDILHGSGHHAGCSHAVAKKVCVYVCNIYGWFIHYKDNNFAEVGYPG